MVEQWARQRTACPQWGPGFLKVPWQDSSTQQELSSIAAQTGPALAVGRRSMSQDCRDFKACTRLSCAWKGVFSSAWVSAVKSEVPRSASYRRPAQGLRNVVIDPILDSRRSCTNNMRPPCSLGRIRGGPPQDPNPCSGQIPHILGCDPQGSLIRF